MSYMSENKLAEVANTRVKVQSRTLFQFTECRPYKERTSV